MKKNIIMWARIVAEDTNRLIAECGKSKEASLCGQSGYGTEEMHDNEQTSMLKTDKW